MLAKTSKVISAFFAEKGIIKVSDIDIYSYSFEMLLSTVLNLFLLLVYGLITDQIITSVVFSVMFLTLRPVCGGFHAVSHFWCCFTILCIFSGVILTLTFTPANAIMWLSTIFALIGFIVIWFNAPVEDKNKPLNDKEIEYFKKKARSRSAIYSITVIFCTFFFKESKTLYTISICIIIIACMMLIAKYKNFRRKNYENLENSCP